MVDLTGKAIVVVGATGLQGRSVTRHLLAGGWQVRAVTRDPAGDRATALASAGAQIVRGEMEDIASLTAAAQDAYGMFSVQPTVGSPGTARDFTADDEVRWGMNVAEAAHAAGIAHFVFSSIAGADRHGSEVLPRNVVSKSLIEQHIAKLGLPATVLRPASFMENFTGRYALVDGTLASALDPAVPQQVMAVDDVGFITALAFARPQEWIGQAMALAGDELNPVQIAAAIENAIGRPLPYTQIPIETIRAASKDFAFAYEWLNERGYRVDVSAVRQVHPAVMDMRAWLDNSGAAKITEFLAAHGPGSGDK